MVVDINPLVCYQPPEPREALWDNHHTRMFSVLNNVNNINNVGIFALLKKIENEFDREMSQFNLSSKHHDNCKLVLKPLEVVQKCQCLKTLCIKLKLDWNK